MFLEDLQKNGEKNEFLETRDMTGKPIDPETFLVKKPETRHQTSLFENTTIIYKLCEAHFGINARIRVCIR